MRLGLINKISITTANVTDTKGLKHVLPSSGVIYADKVCCKKDAHQEAKASGCHLAAIKKNNMKEKNRDQDCWYSRVRSPHERAFSQIKFDFLGYTFQPRRCVDKKGRLCLNFLPAIN